MIYIKEPNNEDLEKEWKFIAALPEDEIIAVQVKDAIYYTLKPHINDTHFGFQCGVGCGNSKRRFRPFQNRHFITLFLFLCRIPNNPAL